MKIRYKKKDTGNTNQESGTCITNQDTGEPPTYNNISYNGVRMKNKECQISQQPELSGAAHPPSTHFLV